MRKKRAVTLRDFAAGRTPTLYGVLPCQFEVAWWRLENCSHNMYRAFRQRLVNRTHLFDQSIIPIAQAAVQTFLYWQNFPIVQPVEPSEVVFRAGAFTRKGVKMRLGADDYSWMGDDIDSDEEYNSMTKFNENYALHSDEPLLTVTSEDNEYDWCEPKADRDPRVIIYPGRPIVHVREAVRLIPVEDMLCEHFAPFGTMGPQTRVLAKGLSPFARAALFIEKSERFSDPVYIKLDGARWDRQYNSLLHSMFYAILSSVMEEEQWHVLFQLLANHFDAHVVARYTDAKVEAIINDGVLTGEYKTGIGNVIAFILIMIGYCTGLKLVWELIGDGDDVILFIERTSLALVLSTLPSFFHRFGHNLTVDGVYFSKHEVVFCQARLVRLNIEGTLKWSFVRDPRVIVSKCSTHPEYVGSLTKAATHLYLVALGELVLNRGAPFVQTWCVKIMAHCMKNGAKPFAFTDVSSSLYQRLRDYLCEVGQLSRVRAPTFTRSGKLDVEAINIKLLQKYKPVEVLPETYDDYDRSFGLTREDWGGLESHIILPFDHCREPEPNCSCAYRPPSCKGKD